MGLYRSFIEGREKDWATALLLGVVLTLVCWIGWEMSPNDSARGSLVTGTVRALRKTWPSESKYAGIVRLPLAEVEVALPGAGGVLRLTGDIKLLDQCRVGASIKLIGSRANGGWQNWGLAPRPCN
ncbi:MAG: hypothetical protein EOP60_03875 [Sphingomonadales bacterium]|nr:MAG: hypothetical protein EOP60_03875 [Sphingomonadales bacterium]